MRSRNQRSCEITLRTRELSKRFFQCAQCFHVEVVGRFVEKQHVAARTQHLGQMHPVALAAGQTADAFLLIRPLKLKRPT